MSRYLFRVLTQKIWVVAIIALVVGAVSYYFLREIPQKYKSTAQVSARFEANVGVLASTTGNRKSPARLQSHIEAMKTEFIGMMVSYNLLLHDLDEDAPFRSSVSAPLSPSEQKLSRSRLREKLDSFETLSKYDKLENKLMEILQQKNYEVSKWINEGDLIVDRIGDTNFIKVQFQSENPLLSAYVVNTLCSEYIRYSSYPIQNGNDSLQLFFDLAEKKKEELETKTEAVIRYQASVQEVDNGDEDKLARYESELREAERKVNKVLTSLRTTNSKIADRNNQSLKTDGVDPGNSPKALELQTKIDQLNIIYVEKGSSDVKLKTTIADLQRQLQGEMNRLASESGTPDYQMKALVAEKKELESAYKKAESGLLSARSNVSRLKKGKPKARSGDLDIISLERARDSASVEYAAAVQKFESRKNAQGKSERADLELLVMGEPNAEPETLSALTMTALVTGLAWVIVSVIVLVATYARTPRRPIHPTFVVTR